MPQDVIFIFSSLFAKYCCFKKLLYIANIHIATCCLQFFIVARAQETLSLDDALKAQEQPNKELQRTQPYILLLGASYFLIVDGCQIIIKPSTLSIAFDCLIKCYYVFNVQFPNQLGVCYTFLQNVLLNMNSASKLTSKALKLANEIQKS